MDVSRLAPVYYQGDSADTAYIVTQGPLYIKVGSSEITEFEANNIVVGTLEALLDVDEFEEDDVGRLFDLYIHPNGIISPLALEKVGEMISQFHFGYNTNIFLAKLLNNTNLLYAKVEEENAKELRAYYRRAETYVKMIDVLFELSERYDLSSLLAFASSEQNSLMYYDGSAYRRQGFVQAVLSPPTPRSRFIELYKKHTLICREGSLGQEMYVLLEGRISVSVGGKLLGHITQAGEAFGELAFFLEGRRTATLVAEEDSHVYVVKHKNIRQFLKSKSPTLFLCTAESLAARVQRNVLRIQRIEQLLRGPEAVGLDITPAPLEDLGKDEIKNILREVEASFRESNSSVLNAYLNQYASQS